MPVKFAGLLPVEISLDAQGRWIGLDADLTGLLSRISEYVPELSTATDARLDFSLSFSALGEPVDLQAPAPADIR